MADADAGRTKPADEVFVRLDGQRHSNGEQAGVIVHITGESEHELERIGDYIAQDSPRRTA